MLFKDTGFVPFVLVQNYYTGKYLKYDAELKRIIKIEMGQKLIDWARPGKEIHEEVRNKHCEGRDFSGSKYLANQWMMFEERHPLCLHRDHDNSVTLKGGMSSTSTKAFSIVVKKC